MKRLSPVVVAFFVFVVVAAGCVPSQAAGPAVATVAAAAPSVATAVAPLPGQAATAVAPLAGQAATAAAPIIGPAETAVAPLAGQAATAVATLTASGAAPAAGPVKRGGTLHAGLNADLTTLDPAMSTAQVDRQVFQSVFNSLFHLEKDLTIKPELADSYQFTDPTTLVLKLHQGVKFQDGTDFNAQAVKANFDRMLDPATASPRRSEIASVKDVTVVDNYTVQLNLKQPDAALLAQLTDRAGMIVSPAAITKYGKDLARNPVGTGPFQFVEWVKDDHLTVKKFDGYWEKGADGQPLPYLDQIIYKPVTDATVRLAGLQTGTLDIIDQVAAKDAPALRNQKALTFDEIPGLGYQGLSLNNKKAPFDKVEARQAVAYAIDRQAIVKNILLNTATAGEGPIPPSSWAYDASVNSIFNYDPAKAKQLLQQAGLTLPVSFPCLIVNTPQTVQLAQAIQQQLAQAGFDMQIQLLDFGTALSQYNNENFTCFQIGWSGRADPDGNTYSDLHTGGGLNQDQYSNPQVDKLLEQARSTYDQAQRKTFYTQALQTAVGEGAIVYLYWPLDQKTWTPKLKGFVHTPDGMMNFTAGWLSQ